MPQSRVTFLTALQRYNWQNYVCAHTHLGFPGGSRICLWCGRPGLDPQVGKILRRKAWQCTPGFLPGEPPWTEEPGGYSQSIHKGLDMTEWLSPQHRTAYIHLSYKILPTFTKDMCVFHNLDSFSGGKKKVWELLHEEYIQTSKTGHERPFTLQKPPVSLTHKLYSCDKTTCTYNLVHI